MRLSNYFARCRILPLALSGLIAASVAQALAQSPTALQYTPQGKLKAPVGFEQWVFVGSNLGMAYKNELPEMTAREAALADQPLFRNIYISPEAYAHFLEKREFPERTVLVLEMFKAADKEPTGILASGVYNGEHAGLLVAVKNSARPDGHCSRPDGSATPWAYYIMTGESACAEPDSGCESCHRQHAGMDNVRDNVWVQFYPTLRKLIK